MLFNKGTRFDQQKGKLSIAVLSDKAPDVPGMLDLINLHCRLADLTAAAGASNMTTRPTSRNTKPPSIINKHADDRYAALLRRIEDLENVHTDDKKRHQAELDRHKSEFARVTKANAEQADKLDKLTKQNEAYEARVQDLKKTSVAEQTEMKELRTKLRMSEHERGQLAKRGAENGDMKKVLSSMEAKRKEDVKETERRVAELEKTLAAEKKKRELLESCLDDVRKKADEETMKLRATSANLQQQLDSCVE
ncbi:hypothetical protein JVU11DRAFT_2643 [Chiua virens]|nr:hypothetical protein JVU11DRAFT_2643 [Chiua virens]